MPALLLEASHQLSKVKTIFSFLNTFGILYWSHPQATAHVHLSHGCLFPSRLTYTFTTSPDKQFGICVPLHIHVQDCNSIVQCWIICVALHANMVYDSSLTMLCWVSISEIFGKCCDQYTNKGTLRTAYIESLTHRNKKENHPIRSSYDIGYSYTL